MQQPGGGKPKDAPACRRIGSRGGRMAEEQTDEGIFSGRTLPGGMPSLSRTPASNRDGAPRSACLDAPLSPSRLPRHPPAIICPCSHLPHPTDGERLSSTAFLHRCHLHVGLLSCPVLPTRSGPFSIRVCSPPPSPPFHRSSAASTPLLHYALVYSPSFLLIICTSLAQPVPPPPLPGALTVISTTSLDPSLTIRPFGVSLHEDGLHTDKSQAVVTCYTWGHYSLPPSTLPC